MYKIFGFVGVSAPSLVTVIKKYKPKTKIFVLGHNDEDELENCKYAIFPNVVSMRRYTDDLIRSDCTVFVSDTYMNLKRIVGIDIVDGEVTETFRTKFLSIADTTIQVILDDKAKFPRKYIKFNNVHVAPKMLKNTPESIMSTVYTFLYKIPNKDRREYARQHILRWLCSPNVEFSEFEKFLKFRGKHGKKLHEFLNSDLVYNFRSLFNKGVDVQNKLQKYNLSEFDYNYMLKFI